jgi:hypothetical protein
MPNGVGLYDHYGRAASAARVTPSVFESQASALV